MASLCKATRGVSGNLFDHYERKKNIKFKNQDIDKTRSYLNYNLAPNRNLSQREILNNRLSEVKVLKRNDINVTCNWVITLPKTIKENSEEERLFFKEIYNFLKNRYGEKNVISSYVHKDEITPHMHFCFIPVVIDKKKNIEKVSAFELITKKELNSFHKELNNYMTKIFNRDIGILNGATANGNKTVLEMKNEQLEKELNKISNKTKKYNTTLEKIKSLEIKDTLIGNAVKGISSNEIIELINESSKSLKRKKELSIAINEIKKLLEKNEKLQTENEKLKEELKENKISLKNKVKEKNLFISGGSDFHGTRKKNHNLGTGNGNLCIDESFLKNWINKYLPDFNSSKVK